MFRFIRRVWRVLPGILAGLFIILIIWLFVVFPRAVNMLADLLGNMGDPLIAQEQLIHTVIALIASLIPLYFLIIRPFQQVRLPHDGHGLVVRQGQGVAYIDTESVRNQVYRAVTEIGAIKRVEVSIESDGGRAAVLLNLTTENNINGGRKKQEIRREVKKVVEDQLGVQLAGEPTINFRLAQIEPDIPQAMPIPEPAPQPPVNARPVVVERPVTAPAPLPPPRREEPPPLPAAPASNPVVTRRPFVPTESTAVKTDHVVASDEDGHVADTVTEPPTQPGDE
ncbi:MAG: hypothetical protein KF716_02750 [Anaerolineae bacterium]|nr:hypothetical protein [Anaerolineae bacterium]